MNRILVYIFAILIFLFGSRIVFQDNQDILIYVGIFGVSTVFAYLYFYAKNDPLKLIKPIKPSLPVLFWTSTLLLFATEIWSLLIIYGFLDANKILKSVVFGLALLATGSLMFAITKTNKTIQEFTKED